MKGRIIFQEEAVNESYNRFYYNRKREWGLYGADTGIHPLNMAIGGWVPGKLTVIAARSGHGKTALTPQMFQAGRRVEAGKRAEYIFFSWETEASYIIDRHVCNEVGITLRHLTQGAKLLGPSTLKLVDDGYSNAKSLPVRYHMNSTDIDDVSKIYKSFSEECKEKSQEEGIHVVPVLVVDYIGLAQYNKNSIRSYDVADFVNGVKKLVNSERGAACLLAQIKRSSDSKELPDRSDLSDSQSIEQAADNMIILHRPEYNQIPSIKDPDTEELISSTNKAIFRVLKARDGKTGDVIVGCDIKYFRFYDLKHNFDTQYWNSYRERSFWIKEFGL
jgi:replicative DNA helicase